MSLNRGCVVQSRAGRDKDRLLVVVGTAAGMPLVCDGKERPLERPKRKNAKHLCATRYTLSELQMSTNRKLKFALRTLAEQPSQEEAQDRV